MTSELKPLEDETARQERLKVLAEEIRQEHQACYSAMRQGVEHALKVGELLLQAKKNVWHGEWEWWVKTNCGFTPRTARTYMRVASHRNLLKTEEISEMTVTSFLLTAETATRKVDVESFQELEESRKKQKERWKLENEQHQVKEYLDALKVFVQAVREVIPAAEFDRFSPEGAVFTMRRHEELRKELDFLEGVFRQKVEVKREPGVRLNNYEETLNSFTHVLKVMVSWAEGNRFSPEVNTMFQNKHSQVRQELGRLEEMFRKNTVTRV